MINWVRNSINKFLPRIKAFKAHEWEVLSSTNSFAAGAIVIPNAIWALNRTTRLNEAIRVFDSVKAIIKRKKEGQIIKI